MSCACRAEDVVEMLREEEFFEMPEQVAEDDDLFAMGMDSMAVMQLIVVIEEKWGVALGAAEASRESLGTPARLAATIESKR